MTLNQELEARGFFYEHAGYSFEPARETAAAGRARCATELARAELALRESPAWVEWEADPEGTVTGEHPAYIATLFGWSGDEYDSPPTVLASLGGIDSGEGEPYRRVVEAELALEAGYGTDG